MLIPFPFPLPIPLLTHPFPIPFPISIRFLLPSSFFSVTQCAVEPVWYLPEIARRFGVDEVQLREALFKETNMMYPELVTRGDLKVRIGCCGCWFGGDFSVRPVRCISFFFPLCPSLVCRSSDHVNHWFAYQALLPSPLRGSCALLIIPWMLM